MKLIVTVKTKSNLYIGGMPQGYSLGGIDMVTAMREDNPYIPASSFKGALREICREFASEEVEKIYSTFQAVKEPFDETQTQEVPKHLYIFGIPSCNRSPKLVFSDLTFKCKELESSPLFSIESKNQITESDGRISSNPRTYKTAAPGLIFKGEIWIRGFDSSQSELVYGYIKDMVSKFNDGAYRLGNSKSRGYGHVYVTVKEADKSEDDSK